MSMKKLSAKVLAFALSVCMVLSMVPTNVRAAEIDSTDYTEQAAENTADETEVITESAADETVQNAESTADQTEAVIESTADETAENTESVADESEQNEDGIEAYAAEVNTAENVEKVKSYTAQIISKNWKNDYTKAGFTWDSEGKSTSWIYYNGFLMDAFLMAGNNKNDDTYKYADAFYNSNIKNDGTTVNSLAGKDMTQSMDSIEPARALFDLLDSDNAAKYQKAIQYIFNELEACKVYTDCGGNYQHKVNGNWDTWNIALDGIYMAQPFVMQCANAIEAGKLTLTHKNGGNVTAEELYNAVYNRVIWIADNMYDSKTGLYNHGYNVSGKKVNGHFWGRGMGWYAMAIADVTEMMTGATRKAELQARLVKLFDGLLNYQDEKTGMWYNVVNRGSDLKGTYANELETSGSAMMAYAMLKAYNAGLVDAKYGEAGLKAFNGIIANKMTGSEGSYDITGINQQSSCCTDDAAYCRYPYVSTEAKGVAPVIMAASQANAAEAKLNGNGSETPDQPEVEKPTTKELKDETTDITVTTVAESMAVDNRADDENVKAALADKLSRYVVYDITLDGYNQGTEAVVNFPIPEDYNADVLKAYYVSADGKVEEINGTAADGKFTFTTNHFSVYAVGEPVATAEEPAGSVSAEGNLPGGNTYTLATSVENGGKYLIVNTKNSGTGYALRNNNGSAATQLVTISNNTATISTNEDACIWTFTSSNSSWKINNGNRYLRMSSSSNWFSNNTSATNTVSTNTDGSVYISNGSYLVYSNSSFGRNSSSKNAKLYLFKQEPTSGATVKLTVSPANAALKPTETVALNPTVLVDDKSTTNYQITWKSSDTSVATVDSTGKVTAVKDGNATITATLTSANGKTPTKTVEVKIPVTVQSRKITNAVLSGNTLQEIQKGGSVDFSDVKLTVTYDDDTTEVITTANGLTITGYDVDVIGTHNAEISYNGTVYGNIRVKVSGNPYAGLEDATVYPQYPNDGAVRIDKKASGVNLNSTGVAKVELDAAGISVKKGVDVVLVVDVSGSMAWTDHWFDGMSDSQVTSARDRVKIPGAGAYYGTVEQHPELNNNKLTAAMESASRFADILLKDNVADSDFNNSISFVTFAGHDAQHASKNDRYMDSVQTVFTNVQDAGKAKTAFDGTRFIEYKQRSGDVDAVDYFLKITDENGKVVSGESRGNTNYDYAFGEANAAVNALHNQYDNYAATGRETIVLFMTDGAPSHYNNLCYSTAAGGVTDSFYSGSGSYSNPYQSNGGKSAWMNVIKKPNTYAQKLNSNIDGFYAIGFDLNHGGFGNTQFTAGELEPVLKGLAGEDSVEVKTASNSAELLKFFSELANKIKFAGTNAKVTDTVNSNFTLQTAKQSGTGDIKGDLSATPPVIEVTEYDLYTKANTPSPEDIGKRTGVSKVLETVTFNDEGTEAYSSLMGNDNIMTTYSDGSVVIEAQYFTYTKDAEGTEQFVWEIGDITDKEVALSYYAYLKGSLEGEREKGVYYTNEGANLEYVDINGKHANKVYPMPAVAWGGASTSFEYYLVNAEGEPVNEAGVVIPFENRVVLYGDTVLLNLNADATVEAKQINAAQYLPEGYFLYDVNAYYTVQTSSDGDQIKGGITISKPSPDASKTTGTAPNTVTQNGAQTTIVVSDNRPAYTESRVAFGVRYDLTPFYSKKPLVDDQIVIDYGKAIQVDVAANDVEIKAETDEAGVEAGHKAELAGFAFYNKNTDKKLHVLDGGAETLTTSNGTYTIATLTDKDGKENKVVQFQPTKMLSEVEKVFCVMKVTNKTNAADYYYMYEELDIIPATIMYYETDFASSVFTLSGATDLGWENRTDTEDSKDDEIQNDGTIGVNQIYGFDSTYEDDSVYSNGSSWMVEGKEDAKQTGMNRYLTTAAFSFKGTGFDLISRTGEKQTVIRVDIYRDVAMTNRVKSISVNNTSESQLELYQIPVVSVHDLAYGEYFVKIGVSAEKTGQTITSLNHGGEFYFDAVRVYDPINISGDTLIGDAAIAQAAYTADGEANNSIIEVRSRLVNKKDFDNGAESITNKVVFVDRTAEGVSVSDYTTIGPNNEVYLSHDQGVAFLLNTTTIPASIDIGAKSADGKPVELSANISSATTTDVNAGISVDITSCTAQYYDLMADAGDTTLNDILSPSGAYVIIFNDGNGVLSITDLKVAYGNNPGTASVSVNADVVKAAGKTAPKAEASYDIIEAAFTAETCKLRKDATLIVKTTDDVNSLTVTDNKGKIQEADMTSVSENGIRTWTVTMKMKTAGTKTFTVTGSSSKGETGSSMDATIKVTR